MTLLAGGKFLFLFKRKHSLENRFSSSIQYSWQVSFAFVSISIFEGASGFLGGLVAIRGPPLIFYFLHPPHPITFNKSSQRATGVVIMFCNVLMRMIFYLVNTFSLTSSGKLGFVREDWRLYLSVIACSIAGGLVGSKMFEYLKDSKDTIRGILAVFLLMCGISLLFSAFTWTRAFDERCVLCSRE